MRARDAPPAKRRRVVAASGHVAPMGGIPGQVAQRWSQHAVATEIKDIFRGMLDHIKIPLFEDILNGPPFTTFAEYAEERGQWRSRMPPSFTITEDRGAAEAAMGFQLGVLTSKHALEPLVRGNPGPEGHMREAIRIANAGYRNPVRRVPCELDLRFAAGVTVANAHKLSEARRAAVRAIRELARRCDLITRTVRAHQKSRNPCGDTRLQLRLCRHPHHHHHHAVAGRDVADEIPGRFRSSRRHRGIRRL